MFGGDISELEMTARAYGNIYRIRIYDPNQARYEVPISVRTSGSGSNFIFESKTDPFAFRISRSGSSTPM